ncbi:MAG: hypothetical protein U0V70_07260 [Terriglobia bacterium]
MSTRAKISVHVEIDGLPEPVNLPIIDTSSLENGLTLKLPLESYLGKGFLRRRFNLELKTRYESGLEECRYLHEKRLMQWSQQTMVELRRAFDASAESLRPQMEGFNPSGAPDPSDVKP